MESMSHPPYSPDFVPSDLFWFRLVKKRPDRFECEDPDDVLETITEISGTRWMAGLQRVFYRYRGWRTSFCLNKLLR
jgi:hypothetical protein